MSQQKNKSKNKKSQLRQAWEITNKLPMTLRLKGFTLLFGSTIKFFGTAGLRFTEVEPGRMVVKLRNQKKVQNHIKGVHAAAMALLGESATGAVFGFSLPSDKLPLVKHMDIDYVRRAKGDLTAVATLNKQDLARMEQDDKGEVNVKVVVTDEDGEEPIKATFIWAWIPVRKK